MTTLILFPEMEVFVLSLRYYNVPNAVYNVLHCQTACEPNAYVVLYSALETLC